MEVYHATIFQELNPVMSSTYTAFAISDLLKALAWLELFHDQECPTNLRKEKRSLGCPLDHLLH